MRFSKRRHHRLLVVLIPLFVSLLVCGCGPEEPESTNVPEVAAAPPPAAAPPAPREAAAPAPRFAKAEFLAIAKRLTESDNSFFGTGQADELRNILAAPDLSKDKIVEYCGKLSKELLRVGDIDGAIEQINTALKTAQQEERLAPLLPTILRVRGVIYLRQAELANCIARHNADCCIFPLGGGGIHEVRSPAEHARDSFLACLKLDASDLRSQWSLNLTHMALGDYPDAVPEAYRIPANAFESDYEIGRFVDIAAESAIDTFNLAGGSIVEDFDNDGFLDIITSTSDPNGPLTFYRNLGNGQFEDRSVSSNLADQLGGLNCVSGDYNNDGFVDVFVLRGGWLFDEGRIRNSLLQNNGDGTFTDVTRRAGLADPAYPTQTAAWGDFDGDGNLDLYVGNESRVMRYPLENHPSQLFRNNGDGTFTDIADRAGVTNDRYCKGVAVGDYDNDGDLDIYVSNIRPNRLYRNNGDGTFTDVAEEAGVAEPTGRSFATWFFDYDNDGWLDLFVAAYSAQLADIVADALGVDHDGVSPCLYRNNGDGTFTNVTAQMGIDHPYMPMGANFGDLDNDGFLDFYLATGNPDFQTLTPNVMMRNDRGLRFQDVTASGGFGHLQKGHGVSFADIDNDGDQDIYHQLGGMLAGDGYYNALFRNPGHGNHFLIVKLVGTETNRSAYGARIKVVIQTPQGPREIHRAVGSVSSFGGSPSRQEIGLGNATAIQRLEVSWPKSGLTQTFTDLPMNTMIKIVEGRSTFKRVSYDAIDF